MADLDDFFAKKDRKKKTKKAGLSTVELVKKLEETTLREHETPNLEVLEEEEQAPVKTFEQPQNDDDSEWKTIESTERKVDLSNLKLIVKSDDYSDSENYQGSNEESQFESGVSNGEANPWKSVSAGGEGASGQQDSLTNSNKKYVAPGSRVSRKIAPDLSSQAFFPSLGTDPVPKLVKRDGFEEVKHGKGVTRAQSSTVTPSAISTDNTYSSLLNDSNVDS